MSYGGSASHETDRFDAYGGGSQRQVTAFALEVRAERAGWEEVERFLRRKQARAALRARLKGGTRRRDLRIKKTLTTIEE